MLFLKSDIGFFLSPDLHLFFPSSSYSRMLSISARGGGGSGFYPADLLSLSSSSARVIDRLERGRGERRKKAFSLGGRGQRCQLGQSSTILFQIWPVSAP